ncbi:MAG TPA: bifunctional 4-hydroxy-2-oxoglutarate aldolase/2-dehydro-3-deoxy-phosphogluconate aldolase [Chthoniobacteraceae bacterium]|nr:bifunctional 4-hydroxy-2-oxoglutarate aldolase/2-dehydro-3-deoxy-phosphogluconate aldolase [Chthoniobacteraceae bacterium]
MHTGTTPFPAIMDRLAKSRLICVAVIDRADDAVPLAESLLAGGIEFIEVTFRTAEAVEALRRIRESVPAICAGAGTLLTPDDARRAADAGAQFAVAPGLDEAVLATTREISLPFFPGVMTPTELSRALRLGCSHLKFFPSAASGGAAMLKAVAGPFLHTGVKFIPTGGITAETLPDYLAIPQVLAVGGMWMADRALLAEKAWGKITALAAQAVDIAATTK